MASLGPGPILYIKTGMVWEQEAEEQGQTIESLMPAIVSIRMPSSHLPPLPDRAWHTAGHQMAECTGEDSQFPVKSNVQGPCTTSIIFYSPSSRHGAWSRRAGLLCAFSFSQSQTCRRSSKSIMTYKMIFKELDQDSDQGSSLGFASSSLGSLGSPSLFPDPICTMQDRTRSVVLRLWWNQNEMLKTRDGSLGPT